MKRASAPSRGVVVVFAKADPVAENPPGPARGHRVVRHHPGPALQESTDRDQARCLAHVVGVRFEGQAPKGEGPVSQVLAEAGHGQLHEQPLLALVDLFHGVEDGGIQFQFTHRARQSLHVLGETGAAVPHTGEEVGGSDPPVGTHAQPHLVHIGAGPLAHPADHVHEADPGGEHRVRRILGDFGRGHVHYQDLVAGTQEGCVQVPQHRGRLRVFHTHDNPVGLLEVADRSAFAEELGVGTHVNGVLGFGLDHLADPPRGPHGYRALRDHDTLAVHRAPDVPGGRQHVLQIGRTVFVLRCSHRDEDDVRIPDRARGIDGETEASLGEVLRHQRIQARLEEGDPAPVERLHLLLDDVHADHVVARLGQTGARGESDVSAPHDGDSHRSVVIPSQSSAADEPSAWKPLPTRSRFSRRPAPGRVRRSSLRRSTSGRSR